MAYASQCYYHVVTFLNNYLPVNPSFQKPKTYGIPMIKWHPPDPSFVKINFDASVQHNKATIGFVTRDSNDNPITAIAKYIGDINVLASG